MAALAFSFLVLTALALRHFERSPEDLITGRLLGWLIAVAWVPLVLEALAGYLRSGDYSWRSTGRLLLIWSIPPFRLSISTYPRGRCIWLPKMGWRVADRTCFEQLERAFSIPMLFMALMILPILAVEFLGAKYVVQYQVLALILDLGIAAIWIAFATEFIVMSAIADKKLAYLGRHWLNLTIILLPFLAFLRGLQITRLLRLGSASKALKIYRLRGLGMRAWKGVVTLELLERVLYRSPESRLHRLHQRLEEKEREIQQLRDRIESIEATRTARDADVSSNGDGP